MAVAIEEEVRAVLSVGRRAKLHRAFHNAWRDVAADQGKYAIWPRTRANMMFERLAVRLQEEFADDQKVVFCFADETVKIAFDDIVLARCKKANDRGFGQNILTQAVMTFCEAQEELPGFRGLQKVEIVYIVNKTGTSICDIVVQCRDGDMRLWAYAIDGTADGAASAPVILFPHRPAPPTQQDGSELVQPRKPKAPEEDTGEN